MSETMRVPPQAVEAEQCILGSMMLDNRHIDTAANWLEVSDFYRQDHQLIFDSILKLDAANSPADVVTVSEFLIQNDQLETVGGLAYLGLLAKNTPDSGNITAYAKIVREKAKYRKIIEQCSETIENCYEPGSNKPEEIINKISLSFDALDKNSSTQNESGMRELLGIALDGIEQRSASESQLLGYPTGLKDLDHRMGGLQRGHLVVVAGRPSMGKSCFSLAICDPALEQGAKVKVFALEMSRAEVAERNLSRWSSVDFGRIRNAKRIMSEDWPKLTASVAHWNSKSLSVDDSSNLNINQIRARCRVAKRNEGLEVVVIDYLSLMQLRPDVNKTEAIGEVTRALKIMARELDCCVILLSQLNRGLENRPNKRPVMSDLRDSGAIEQDADQIIFLYRDEVYNPNTDYKGVCEIDLAKYRNGETGVTKVYFEGHFQRYKGYSNITQFTSDER